MATASVSPLRLTFRFLLSMPNKRVFPRTPAAISSRPRILRIEIGSTSRQLGSFLQVPPGLAAFYGGAVPQRLSQRNDFALDIAGGSNTTSFRTRAALGTGRRAGLLGGRGTGLWPRQAGGVPLGTRGKFQSTVGILFTLSGETGYVTCATQLRGAQRRAGAQACQPSKRFDIGGRAMPHSVMMPAMRVRA